MLKNVELFSLCSTNIPLIPKSFWMKLSIYDCKSADHLHIYTYTSLKMYKLIAKTKKGLKFKHWKTISSFLSYYT